MEDSKRKQIEERLKIQKIQKIHQHFDKDDDGYLNHSELSALQTITSGKQAISRKKYKTICNSFDCKPSQGLTFRALLMTYSSGGEASIDSDFDAVFGINRPESKDDGTHANSNGNGNGKGDGNAATRTVAILKQYENGLKSEHTAAELKPFIKETPKTTSSRSLLDLLNAGDDPIITRTPFPGDESPQSDVTLNQNSSKDTLKGLTNSIDLISEHGIGSKELSSISLADTEAATNIKAKKLQSPQELLEKEKKLSPIYVRPPMEGIVNMSKSKDHPVMEGSVYEDFLPKIERRTDDECCACAIM
jgi:hypothetical protein